MESQLKKIVRRRPAPVLVLAFLSLLFAGQGVASATSSVNVAGDTVYGNPFEVHKNQLSTLTYKITYSVGPNSEGVTPSLSSIAVVFTAEGGAVL